MSNPRERVAAAARAAGLGAADLEQIATALWPDYTPGDTLTDRRLHALCVEPDGPIALCRDSHVQTGTLTRLLAAYRDEHGDQWRTAFWHARLRIARTHRGTEPRPPIWGPGESLDAAEGLPALEALTGRAIDDLITDPDVLATAEKPEGVSTAA